MSRTRYLVLGAGRVGRAIAFDLAADEEAAVTVADVSSAALDAVTAMLAPRSIEAEETDLADPTDVTKLAAGYDLVVGALPSALGYAALGAVIEAGVDVVGISFFVEDPFQLDGAARRRGVTVVVDCGVAPGLDNLILGQRLAELESVDRFICLVGGLPADPRPPWYYRAPFAPIDVLAEYVRPVRLVVDGEVVVRPALGEVERLELPGVGTVEAFLTDGLRTLVTTTRVPNMVEKTVRHPGHADAVRLLRDGGFLSEEIIRVGTTEVTPLEVTSRILFPQWELAEAEDLTVMRVVIEGTETAGAEIRETWDLLDRRDPQTGLSSMARTTGFTASAIARLVATGRFRRAGVSAGEHVGQTEGCAERVLQDLGDREVEIEVRREAR